MKKTESRRKRLSYVLKPIWKVAYEKLEAVLPESAMREWVDHFELRDLTMKKAVILMTGNADLNRFRDLYGSELADCLYEVLGYEVDIRFKQKRVKVSHGRVALKRFGLLVGSLILLALAALVVVTGISWLRNQTFRETFYQVSSGKITGDLRVIQLSDLHNTVFREDNDELVRRIGLLEPDIIVMTGDMIDQDDADWDVTVRLCERLTGIAPVYFIYGNNECTRMVDCDMELDSIDALFGMGEGTRDAGRFRGLEDGLRTRLEEVGVHVLLNESATVQVGKNTVDIYGVLTSNPSAFWPYAADTFGDFLYSDTGNFKLLLCHEPYIFQELTSDSWGDLILCGHTHGGIIRVPRLGALYERSGGLFPERGGAYILGQYSVDDTPLIVSGGLTNRGIPRINNQPELVIVDVNRY